MSQLLIDSASYPRNGDQQTYLNVGPSAWIDVVFESSIRLSESNETFPGFLKRHVAFLHFPKNLEPWGCIRHDSLQRETLTRGKASATNDEGELNDR